MDCAGANLAPDASKLVMVCGPFRAESATKIEENVARLREAGAAVYARGWMPIVGVLAANASFAGRAPIDASEYDELVMPFCLRVATLCDGAYVIGESAGVEAEIARFRMLDKPVARDLDQLGAIWTSRSAASCEV